MKAIIVLGMHRSGTSALTGVLSLMGADPGARLMPPIEGINPKGFWENTAIVACHEALLTRLASSWHDDLPLPEQWWKSDEIQSFRSQLLQVVREDFGGKALWLLKDPRICRLLPLWLDLLEELKVAPYFVLCVRHPLEVAKSLNKRDGILEDKACMSWLGHVLESERWSRNYPRVIIRYDQLLDDWRGVTSQIADAFGFSEQVFSWGNANAIDEFLEPMLRHHRSDQDERSVHYPAALAIELYQSLVTGQMQAIPGIQAQFDLLAKQIASLPFRLRELHKKPGQPFCVQLFIDTGEGFSEEESIALQLDHPAGLVNLSFELSDRNNLQALRLDPLDDCVLLKIEAMKLVSNAGTIDLSGSLHTNCLVEQEGVFYFNTCDPQVWFDDMSGRLDGAIRLEVGLNFLTVGEAAEVMALHQVNSIVAQMGDQTA